MMHGPTHIKFVRNVACFLPGRAKDLSAQHSAFSVFFEIFIYLFTSRITITYVLTYLLHGAESFLRS